jgi:hypothetical protein
MPSADIIAAGVIVAVLVVLAFGIRGSIRRGPTLAQRYKGASPEERRRLDDEMERNPWLRAKMQPLSIWAIVGGLLLFFVFKTISKWLAN